MKSPLFLAALSLSCLLAPAALVAQAADQKPPTATAAGTPRADQLVQQQAARRAELVRLREQARAQLLAARNDGERKAILRKLESDEQSAREALAQAQQARANEEKGRRATQEAARPRG